MKWPLTSLFLLGSTQASISQNSQVIAVVQNLNIDNTDLNRFRKLIALGEEFVFNNADSAIFYNKAALNIAKELKENSLMADAYYGIAAVEATTNNYAEALLYCDSAVMEYKKANNINGIALAGHVQGGVYMSRGSKERAAEIYFQVIEYIKNDTLNSQILYTYHNLVILLNNMGKHEKALEYAKQQYRKAQSLNLPEEISYACSNIIETYLLLEDSAKVFPYINRFCTFAEGTQDSFLKVKRQNHLGLLKYLQRDYKKSIYHYKQSLSLNYYLIDQQLVSNTLISLGKAYQKTGNFKMADYCFLKVIRTSHKLKIKEERRSANELHVKSAVSPNDNKSAFEYVLRLQAVKDTLQNEKSEMALANSEYLYKLIEKQEEVDVLKKEQLWRETEVSKHKAQKQLYFFTSIALALLSLLLFNRYKLKRRIEQQQALFDERNRISKELHDDLGGGLSTIRLMTEMVKDEKLGLTTNHIENISAKSRELIQNMNEIVWSLNTENDHLPNLLAYIRQYAITYLEELNIKAGVTLPEEVKDVTVNSLQRRQIFLIIKEALHNVIKHANADQVDLTIRSDEMLEIRISDNGYGISEETLSELRGNGLRNMRDRIKLLGGKMNILNQNGTTLIFEIPLLYIYNKRAI